MSEVAQPLWKRVLRDMFAGFSDPKNRRPCEVCDGAGKLFTVTGRAVDCAECHGDGSVLIRSPFDDLAGVAAGLPQEGKSHDEG